MQTARLDFLPQTSSHFLALVESVAAFERLAGLRAADGLRDFAVSPEISPEYLARMRAGAGTPADPWKDGYLLVERAPQVVIGSCGYKGPPDSAGTVEIAYGVVPSREGQGFATEAAQALVAQAFSHAEVQFVRAHTLPQANASTRVLTKCGFRRVGEIIDPEDGPVWRWEKKREP